MRLLTRNQKGFTHPILILLIVAGLATLGGLIYYKSYKEKVVMLNSPEVAGAFTPTTQIEAIAKAECDIFVAPNGNDSNNGRSEENAYRSINKAIQEANAGEAVCLKGGEYRQIVNITKNGTASQPIKIGGYTGGGLPMVTGGITNGDEYKLPNPQCQIIDKCGPRIGGGRCTERNKCMFNVLFTVNNSSYLHFIGIDVSGSSGRGISAIKSSYLLFNGVRSYHHWNTAFAITEGTDNTLDKTATFDNMRAFAEKGLIGGGGLHIQSNNVTVKNSLIFENFGEGLDVQKSSRNMKIIDNMFWDNYHASLYANATQDATLSGNFVFCTGNRVPWLQATGFGADKSQGSGITLRNETGITSAFGAGHGLVVANNTVVGCTKNILVSAQDGVTIKDVKVVNNTVISPRTYPGGKDADGISVAIQDRGGIENILVANNIVVANLDGKSISGGEMGHPEVSYINNLVSKNPQTPKQGITVGDPKVYRVLAYDEKLNPETITASDFVITAQSPAVNAGQKLPETRNELDRDFFDNNRNGTPIDLGSYEVGGSKSWANLYNVIMKGAGSIQDFEDRDGDGVANKDDLCPDTPAGTNPDPEKPGCPAPQGGGDDDDDDDDDDQGTIINIIKNSRFRLEPTDQDEFALYWTKTNGKFGDARAEVVAAGPNALAKNQVAKLTILRNPISGYAAISQKSVKIKPNTTYKVSFVARSTTDARLLLTVRDMGYVQESLAPGVSFNVGKEWKEYTTTIRTTSFNPRKLGRVFLGYKAPTNNSVLIDFVKIYEQ